MIIVRNSRVAKAILVLIAAPLLLSQCTTNAPTTHRSTHNTRPPTPVPTAKAARNGNGQLNGVSCPSARFCLAIGRYLTNAGSYIPLVERWDGRAWATAPAPLVPAGGSITPTGISCATTASCVAVGSYSGPFSPNRQSQPFAEHWNGAHWTMLPTPNPGGTFGRFTSVACGAPTSCVAIGDSGSGTGPFVEDWNGARWAADPPLLPAATSPTLTDASCSSSAACLVVGSYTPGPSAEPVSEYWNGKGWSLEHVPLPADGTGGSFSALSCLPTGRCLAIGTYDTTRGTATGLAELWNGTRWSAVAGPAIRGGTDLLSVSCMSTTECLAVGETIGDSSATPVAAAWNGHAWNVVPAPSPKALNASLDAVSCGPSLCTPIGFYSTKAPIPPSHTVIDYTLGESFNGKTLTIVPTVDGTSPTTSISPGVVWLSKGCPSWSGEIEEARDPRLGYLYADWIGCDAISITFVRSTDGGRTFSKPFVFHDGSWTNAWDPAVTVAPDGTLYVSFMTSRSRSLGPSWPLVYVSHDHGASFTATASLEPSQPNNWGDRDFVAAGANGTVFVSWDYGPNANDVQLSCFPSGSCAFSHGDLNIVVQRSTDYGRHWGPIVHVSAGFPAGGADAAPLTVEPNGRIDLLYQALSTNPNTFSLGPGHEYFSSSNDGGATWSAPVAIAPAAGTESVDEWWIDGDLGIDSAGNLYATWDTQGARDIGWLSYSTNHGLSWSAPVRVTPDNNSAVHIVQVIGTGPGYADVGWLTNSSPLGYELYLRPFSIRRGWLAPAVLASRGTYGPGAWPGDTFGMVDLQPNAEPGQECVAVTWGGGVMRPLGVQQGDMFATNKALGHARSALCPQAGGSAGAKP